MPPPIQIKRRDPVRQMEEEKCKITTVYLPVTKIQYKPENKRSSTSKVPLAKAHKYNHHYITGYIQQLNFN